jgi:hypothetical protein
LIFNRNILSVFILLSLNYNCKTTASDLNIDSNKKVRYVEMYGSICCPRDYKYDHHLIGYIDEFETTNNVAIKSSYKLPLGKEGEATYFLSLDNLSQKLQEEFINGRLKILKANDSSIKNYLKNPITIKQALQPWKNYSINNLTLI